MEENKPSEFTPEEYVPADVDCSNCTGNWVQTQVPAPKERLFTPIIFIKWRYICQKCGLASKIYCQRAINKIQ